MGLPKGKTNNKAGRPKGSKGRVSKELKTWVKLLIESNTEQLEKDLQSLDAKDRWLVTEKLLQFIIPKAVTKIEAKDTTPPRVYPPARVLTKEEVKEMFIQLDKDY